MHASKFRPELLQGHVGLVGLLAPLLDLAALGLQFRRQTDLLGGQPFPLGPQFLVQELAVGGQLCVEMLQGRAARLQFRFRLGQKPLPLRQRLRDAAERFVLDQDRLARFGRLLQRRVFFLEPLPSRPGVAFQLRGPGVEFRFAMIEFLLPAT